MTYCIAGYSRNGSTITAQVVAAYLGAKYPETYTPDYIGEITNIYPHLMVMDDMNRDRRVEHGDPIPVGAYTKTYKVVDGRVTRFLDYDNLNLLQDGTNEFKHEVQNRLDCMAHNQTSNLKSIYKVQTNNFMDYIDPVITDQLKDHRMIFCVRDLKEHFRGWITTKRTGIFHSQTGEIITAPEIEVTEYDYKIFERSIRRTIAFFEKYKSNITEVLLFEDWKHDITHIYTLLGWDDWEEYVTKEQLENICYKKLQYTKTPKDFIKDYDKVMERVDSFDFSSYRYDRGDGGEK